MYIHVHVHVKFNVWSSGTDLYVKRHFYVCDKFMRIRQNRPLDKFMHSSVLWIVTYDAIKIYTVQIYATGT